MRFSSFAPLVLLTIALGAEEIARRDPPESFAQIAQIAAKNAVYIMSANDDEAGVGTPFAQDPWFKPYFQYPQLGLSAEKLRRSLGSGAIISKSGLIVTSARIAQDRRVVKVIAHGLSEPLDARVLGVDQSADLAVLKVVSDNLTEPTLADLSAAQSGDLVFAIGNPFGVEPIVSMGVISALGGQFDGDRLIQSDLYIHGGNIGGVIVNARGELMGVPTYLRGATEREPQSGFFLPIDRVKAVAERIERSGDVKDAWLGIAVSDLSRDMKSYFGRDDGVLITAVEAHSPSANAGLKKGDLLLLADNVMLGDVADLERVLSTVVADRDITFLFLRDKRLREAVLRVGRFETTASNNALRTLYYNGATLETITPAWQERLGLDKTSLGVVAIDVNLGTIAAKSGLEDGDLIAQIDGRDIESLSQFQEAINAKSPESFMIMRGGIAMEIKLLSEQEPDPTR